ncbi:hypothetical protein BDL97_17G076400 [Sphagnum fallax]|nr:hypothetical protein BDL97_17G076400 [Sphagnum fallax]
MARSREQEQQVSFCLSIINVILVALVVVVHGVTDPDDVNAMTNLYSDFGFPVQLTNWNNIGADPCSQNWLGVICSGPNVVNLVLSNLGLNGNLGYGLDTFQSLVVLDLSQNNLAGNLPNPLPPSIQQLNLEGNQFSGNILYSPQQLSKLTNLNLSHNQLVDAIPDIFTNLNNLQTLDLSFNSLTGPLPGSLGDLGALTVLNVQNNQLSGSLPIDLSNLANLQTLNVENNQFTGLIPPQLHPPTFLTGGNSWTSSPASPVPASPSHNPQGRQQPGKTTGTKSSNSFWTGGRIGGISVVVLIILIASLLLGILYIRQRKSKEDTIMGYDEKGGVGGGGWGSCLQPCVGGGGWSSCLQTPSSQSVQQATTPPHKDDVTNALQLKGSPSSKTLKALASFKSFTERAAGRDSPSKSPPPSKSSRGSSIPVTVYSVADLQSATNSFGQENLVGENSLGCVYRGVFQDDQMLAVKVLDKSAPQVQSEQDFLKLVSNIAHIQHANITELVGYCVEHGQRLLVYKYVSNGTLHEALHCYETTATKKHLSWSARAKIALGVARALEYLHEICLPAVVHHNFNSGNILLDDELNPQLSDCGFADLSSPASVSQVSLPPPQMLASVGYSAPEYAMSGVYTMKSDVYRFGVVMLELLTGRKPLDSSRPRAEESLVRWATPQLHDIDTLTKMVDPALKGIYPVKSLSRFADVIALCVQPEPEFRPPMSEVVQALLRLLQRANLSKQQAGENVGRSRNGSLEYFHDSYSIDISS